MPFKQWVRGSNPRRVTKKKDTQMLASTNGLGYMIQMGRTIIRPDIILVGMLVIGCTGALMSFVLGRIEKHIAPWRNRT